MLVGIDTSETRLDSIDWPAFQSWNGGTLDATGKVTGGDPAFAGRNFLGGSFVFAPAEATTARAAPSPTDLSQLGIAVSRIAPIQWAYRERQQVANMQGLIFGQIDAQALCRRLTSKLLIGEFSLPATGAICVWLTVDPTVPISIDYWAGWADTVNNFLLSGHLGGASEETVTYPFRASILCHYDRASGRYQRDPHVNALLTQHPLEQYGPLETTCYSFWADAPDPAGGVSPNPTLDWTLFDRAEMPSIWRFSTSFTKADGTPADVKYSLDVVRESGSPDDSPLTNFMLESERWQPNESGIANTGFIVSDEIKAATLACMATTPLPDMWEFADEPNPTTAAANGHVQIRGGRVRMVGRYLRIPVTVGLSKNEAKRLSDDGQAVFTIFERGSTNIAYFTEANATLDGSTAFAYAGDTLKLPSHTPIYFTVDFDAADPSPAGVATGGSGGPNGKTLVLAYFNEIARQRDLYEASHPDRVYDIGVYGNGGSLDWLYRDDENGVVSYFWQSVSGGGTGNTNALHHRPWYHANRWQYQGTTSGHALPVAWNCMNGIDPDVDWGDGGTWNLNDPFEVALNNFNDRAPGIRRMWAVMSGAFVGLDSK
ncbi:MAG TPA: glycoside hydrolase domain-containing protein [Gemmatimonadaceae bacterium]|jgi:hypothetical protein